MQPGERRFARRLESHLEDDYLCWYDTPVGMRPRYADFIVLHPGRGLLLLEVKDWRLETIQRMDKVSATLLTARGLRTVSNPLEQVRECAYRLVQQLERDPQLIHHEGRHRGKLTFPYGYGVVLSHITRRQFDSTDLGEVLPEHRVICRDEMAEGVDPEAFQKRLWDMFSTAFRSLLTLPQIDRIRWHLFPEIRIPSAQGSLLPDPAEDAADPDGLLPDLVKVMDMQQEQLARSLGEGHRVIHGVAGSGKTLILGYRCLYLAKLMHKPILVLCYNIALANRLREMMAERGLGERVQVYHFHDWCGEQLRAYHVQRPAPGERYIERLVETVIAAVDRGEIPKAQYGAVMIDEGHDFEAEWLRLITGMVDPETNALLLLYDDAQSIYNRRKTLDFTLSSVGIQARGRTTILRLNYRNTQEILSFAYRFIQDYLGSKDDRDASVPIVEPRCAGRHGPPPALRLFDSFAREARYVARTLKRLHDERGIAWADMAVVYRYLWMGQELQEVFTRAGIPCQRLADAQSKKRFRPAHDSVKLMTMHSSKGLEFPVVVVAGLGHVDTEEDPAMEARLLYVAMTRSTEKLLLTAHQQTPFVQRLQALAGETERLSA